MFSRFIFCFFLFIASFYTAFSQGLGTSLYSSFGVGETYSGAMSNNYSTGGNGVSSSFFYAVNGLNPALLAQCRFTTFDVGMLGQYKNSQQLDRTHTASGMNLNNVSLALPMSKRWTTNLRLTPYSFVDYQTASSKRLSNDTIDVGFIYKGSGGINRFVIANGYKATKDLYIGLEASYLFGTIDKESRARFINLPATSTFSGFEALLLDRTNYGDFAWKAGVAWKKKLKPLTFLNIGATYGFATNLNTNRSRTLDLPYSSGGTQSFLTTIGLVPDTLGFNQNVTIHLPSSMRGGVSFEKENKFLLSFDYSRQDWSGYRNVASSNEGLRNSQTFSVGYETIPNISAASGYFNFVQYRFGASYTETPYIVANTPVNDLNVSVGFGLPLGRNAASTLNFGATFGQRGVLSGGGVREQYVRFVFGVSLVDEWFRRSKIY